MTSYFVCKEIATLSVAVFFQLNLISITSGVICVGGEKIIVVYLWYSFQYFEYLYKLSSKALSL